MRERGARWRALRVLPEYSLSLTVTQNEHLVDPRGACCFVFGYRLGTGVPPWGPPPHPGPAVHSIGWTALHWAALFGNRRIVRLLVDADADVNAQDHIGCAVCACGESAIECAGRAPAAVGRAGPRRCTGPRAIAIPHASWSCCCAAPTGPSRTTAGTAALRHTAETETATAARAQGHAEAMGGTEWEPRGVRGGREPGELRPPPHSPATPRASRPIPPHAACAVGCFHRRSPIQRGGRQQPTQHTHCNDRHGCAPRRAPFAPAGRRVEEIEG
jgi:hypothetical protein